MISVLRGPGLDGLGITIVSGCTATKGFGITGVFLLLLVAG